MNSDFGYYIFCIIALIVGFFVFKKVTGCILKTIITFVSLAVVAAIYFLYIK